MKIAAIEDAAILLCTRSFLWMASWPRQGDQDLEASADWADLVHLGSFMPAKKPSYICATDKGDGPCLPNWQSSLSPVFLYT